MSALSPRSKSALSSLALLAAIGVGGLLSVAAQAPYDNALPFTRSYLLTGNYAVVGVDLPPQAADCTTFAPDCYAKGSINVAKCPTNQAGQPVYSPPGGCIPEGADVVAAWMYWEALATDPGAVPVARLRPGGTAAYATLTKARRNDEALPSQGSCLSSAGSPLTLSMFSADVLRFFPPEKDSNNNPTGRRQVVGTHDIALAEVGQGNNARQGAGASLFFVYRLASEPLRKVVVHDGAHLQQPAGAVTRQQIQGFYQSASTPSAWLTHVVGSGAKNTTERIFFNNASTPLPVVDPIPFPLGNTEGGNGSDRAWTNPTFDVSAGMDQTETLSGFGETVWTSVDHTNSSPYECLSWAAVIFSTAVKDEDAGGPDGLPDGLEDAANGLKDPDPADLLNTANPVGRSLPNLNKMGASSAQRDLFIEANGFWAPSGTTYGHATDAPFSTIANIPSVTTAADHYHLPAPEVLQLLGDALAAAPGSPIKLHVDVGDIGVYKGRSGYNSGVADAYLICERATVDGPCTASSAHARGGEIIPETYCNPDLQTANPAIPNSLGCHFPHFPGTVGWKFGFEHYRDAAVDAATGAALDGLDQDECYATGSYTDGGSTSHLCRRRFDPIRAGLFHYFLYAHALGIPKGKPCVDDSVPSSPKDMDFNGTDGNNKGICVLPLKNNPNYHVPRSNSGAGDFPGSGALITLGLWDVVNHVGSAFLQASTSLHELGHNLELSHGGKPPVLSTSAPSKFEPNCKPGYPSIMSYLFQVNGLLDVNGVARIDYSRGAYYDTGNLLPVLNEGNLHDGLLPLPDVSLPQERRYRTAWFVPVIPPAGGQPGNLAYALGVQPATRYCNGVKFGESVPSPAMGRIDGPASALLLDWDLNGGTAGASLDVNFDGVPDGQYEGHNDWGKIRLNQIGGGKNPAGFSLGQGGFEFGQGGFDFGQGGFEFGQGGFDFGQGGFEFGQGGFEFGQGGFDFGQGGFDFGDGGFNLGQGGFDFGQGGFDFGQGGFDYGQGGFDFGNDIDFDLVRRNGFSPPPAVSVAVIQTAGPFLHRNRVTWSAPHVGTVSGYRIYRALGDGVTNGAGSLTMLEQVCGTAGTPACPSGATLTFIDQEELPYNRYFTYFVRAVFNNCNPAVETCQSGPSNFARVYTENTAPTVFADPSGSQNFLTPLETPLVIAAPGVLLNDTDVDSPVTAGRPQPLRAAIVTVPPQHGSLILNANGSFTYTPEPKYSGTDTFQYRADNGTWRATGITMSDLSPTAATVTITIDKKRK